MEQEEQDRFHARSEYEVAVAQKDDTWVAACGGNEVPYVLNGTKWLYVFNPATGKHGYLHMGQDIVYAMHY